MPYMGLSNLHDMGLGRNYAALVIAAETPVDTFICPTRRTAIAYPFLNGTNFVQLPSRPSLIGRSDYAGSSGAAPIDAVNPQVSAGGSPNFYSTGDAMSDVDWLSNWYASYPGFHPNGVIFRRSQCTIADITDGTTNTYLIGERYAWPDHYTDGSDFMGDDQGWIQGYDYDTNRWVQLGTPPTSGYLLPMQDTPGYSNYQSFGSAHSSGFYMAFCDASVQFINYTIDGETHYRLGNREDGLPADPKSL